MPTEERELHNNGLSEDTSTVLRDGGDVYKRQIDTFSDQKMTSDFMAASIGTNPVIVRKILQQLKAAGLIEVARGTFNRIKSLKKHLQSMMN